MAKDSIDTPVPNPTKGVGDAGSLPIKKYPSSTGMATKGPSNSIEGPCDLGSKSGLYHKK